MCRDDSAAASSGLPGRQPRRALLSDFVSNQEGQSSVEVLLLSLLLGGSCVYLTRRLRAASLLSMDSLLRYLLAPGA